MPNAFETTLNLPMPACGSNGACCKGASPSVPFLTLLEKASRGDDFARGFFSIMVPYASNDEARKVVPALVDKTLKAALKDPLTFPDPERDIVFYRCRNALPNNKCGVHEDRPQFCRDYPDSPFLVFDPGCAYLPWALEARDRFNALKAELSELKAAKAALSQSRTEQQKTLSLMLSLTNLSVNSPLRSYLLKS